MACIRPFKDFVEYDIIDTAVQIVVGLVESGDGGLESTWRRL
jgi:hypothetical protein